MEGGRPPGLVEGAAFTPEEAPRGEQRRNT